MKKSKRIMVFIKEPGRLPQQAEIDNDLHTMQRTVDGYIEVLMTAIPGVVLVCNEEGRIKNLPKNVVFGGVELVGTIFFSGTAGVEFADMPMKLNEFSRVFPELFIRTEVEEP